MRDQWTVVCGIVRRSWNLQIGNHGTRLVVLNSFVAKRSGSVTLRRWHPRRCLGQPPKPSFQRDFFSYRVLGKTIGTVNVLRALALPLTTGGDHSRGKWANPRVTCRPADLNLPKYGARGCPTGHKEVYGQRMKNRKKEFRPPAPRCARIPLGPAGADRPSFPSPRLTGRCAGG